MITRVLKSLSLLKAYLIGLFFIWLGFYILSFENQLLIGRIIGWANIIFWSGFLSWSTIKLLLRKIN